MGADDGQGHPKRCQVHCMAPHSRSECYDILEGYCLLHAIEKKQCMHDRGSHLASQNGKTEYKSVTFSPNATAEEFMDLYLDDDYRPNWVSQLPGGAATVHCCSWVTFLPLCLFQDTMIIDHEVIEQGDFSERQQAVRWLRRFPFSFITDREYIIAKRMFKIGQDLYGITKASGAYRGCS